MISDLDLDTKCGFKIVLGFVTGEDFTDLFERAEIEILDSEKIGRK